MSSAFPQTQASDPFGAASFPKPVPERGTHIPGSYMRAPHQDPGSVVVKKGGEPLLGMGGNTFTVAEIAPERRWAVGYDGEVMVQAAFKVAKQQGVLEFYQMLRDNGHPNARYEGKLSNEPIPSAAEFVSWRVDPLDETKLLQIGYDPNPGDRPKQEKFYDSSGEEIMASRMDILIKAYAEPKQRAAMFESERKEVEAHLGVEANASGSDIATRLEVLTGLKEDGLLSEKQFIDQVTALTGKTVEAEEVAAPVAQISDAKQPTAALCGKECKGKVGVTAHERNCKKCAEITSGGEAA